ncbi:ArnT family glycosyltransferase [Gandjariella thermophila]|uniref:Glycosyl transferase family 39 n=1 Tax=Gandjariella thermophila TaxID=1931992 RepID=A0A4D4J3N9_9PSEU|nr:glycosyltransferase family 39 protein [Gandjariella thermophila]GDY29720.1 glycosyl transferase family 39 [Gandjariella thermophila]
MQPPALGVAGRTLSVDTPRASAPHDVGSVAAERHAVPPLARGPVFALAGAVAMVLFAASFRYGYFGDELYFLAAGYHLSWGYADNPALVPLLARAMDMLFPGSVVGLRLPATLFTALGVVLAALIAREMGGARRAQVIAAAAYAVAPNMVGTGHILATSTVDPFCWTLVTWLVVRWVRLRQDRLLLWAGLATAAGLQTKYLIFVFWVVLAGAALLVGPRELLRRRMLWLGGALALLVTLPSVLWQATHGWPQLEVNHAVAVEQRYAGGRAWFVPLALALAGLPVGAVLVCYGLWRLLRSAELRPYRFLGLTALGVTAVFVLAGGRMYYVAGMYAVLWAAAAVDMQRHRPAVWWRWLPTLPVFLLSATLTAYAELPVLPPSQVDSGDFISAGSIGWPELADAVAASYRTLPENTRRDTVIVTDTYWQAAALDRYGPERGLPRAYGRNRGYWYFGRPPEQARTALFVAASPDDMRAHFVDVRPLAAPDNPHGFPGLNRGLTVWLCTGQREPWSVLWPELRRIW